MSETVWTINRLTPRSQPHPLTVAEIEATATMGEHSVRVHVVLQPPAEGASFVPWDDLTPEIVQGWLIDAAPVSSIAAQLQSMQAVVVDPPPLPWSAPE